MDQEQLCISADSEVLHTARANIVSDTAIGSLGTVNGSNTSDFVYMLPDQNVMSNGTAGLDYELNPGRPVISESLGLQQ